MGGDCLNVGCVPSKTLIRAARAAADVRDATRFGVRVPEGTMVDFAEVMARVRRVRAEISPHDSAQRFTSLGVDVFLGEGRFTSPETLGGASSASKGRHRDGRPARHRPRSARRAFSPTRPCSS
jgi:pyruvate/2-oxoglutarate dehydrogenase complex dihydrolipoamide dehydrogenase (E3) component